MDRQLLDILACPVCKSKLHYDQNAQTLLCRFDKLVYPIRDDIPILLEEEATEFKEDD